jgi:predicted GNAT superfamily acetyltransferase
VSDRARRAPDDRGRHLPGGRPGPSERVRTRPLSVQIRALTGAADYADCVELQHLVWGSSGGDTVPPIVLFVSQEVGGIAAGAFDGTGRLAGCVFGLTGLRHGSLAHWSHMLAVRPEFRDRGLGQRLKSYQRTKLLRMGVATMYWSYDPLVARNAHLNLNRLHVHVERYVRDMYGTTGEGPLDRTIGTDRLIVRWDMRGPQRGRRAMPTGAVKRIAIPPDIHALRDRDTQAAREWRRSTRAAFERHLRAGYTVAGFDPDAVRPSYTLVRRRGP